MLTPSHRLRFKPVVDMFFHNTTEGRKTSHERPPWHTCMHAFFRSICEHRMRSLRLPPEATTDIGDGQKDTPHESLSFADYRDAAVFDGLVYAHFNKILSKCGLRGRVICQCRVTEGPDHLQRYCRRELRHACSRHDRCPTTRPSRSAAAARIMRLHQCLIRRWMMLMQCLQRPDVAIDDAVVELAG